ncbi:unnamed protein product [Adineta ricciae]|uniref:Uncharacterized protein n=1 Tax=Adineta ricciae TaxID=249248 RepID=A0A814RP10_ADIRI|nr:unnamed protein product [Adineta ricciae]
MTESNLNMKGKNIWSRITLDQFVAAVASLGDRTNNLADESWRLNDETELSDSLWGQVIDSLKLDHSESTRQAFYKIWRFNRNGVSTLVEQQKKNINLSQNIDYNDYISDLNQINSIIAPNLSLPLPQPPKTRAQEKTENVDINNDQNYFVGQISIVFSVTEWKNVFSRTNQKMKDDWTKTFREKLTFDGTGITCSLKFISDPYFKEGKRKRNCRDFSCTSKCTIKGCTRKYIIVCPKFPDENSSILFLVQIYGKEDHTNGPGSAQLKGKERLEIGERANNIGPLAVYREQVESADERLLAAGNFTGCFTYETIKKSASDYRKIMHIVESIYEECRITQYSFETTDTTSKDCKGYVHYMTEKPFTLHLYCEQQIRRYIKYCTKEHYSYIHIDATGGVIKKLVRQKQVLLYALMFKDGDDFNDTIPVAHAIINQIRGTDVLPSFYIIDFSAALMNAIFEVFNVETVNTHLNRCWNVINGRYTAEELQSASFVHFCCCHAIHAFARNLTSAHINKKIRRGVLLIFVFLLCSNDIKQLYDIFGSLVDIFGDPNEQNAKQKFDQLVSFQFDIDEESMAELTDTEKIFEAAKERKDELIVVDEYLRSSGPIIHYSPFNREAIRLYPTLTVLINKKLSKFKSTNPLYSPSLIRIFYRWWAYLPFWTGLLFNFKERYANDVKKTTSSRFNPVRHSNALIESYFRTLKKSIFQNQVYSRPYLAINDLRRCINIQFKANEYNVTVSSKGRKRKKREVSIAEQWDRKGKGGKRRTAYLEHVDKYAAKRVPIKTKDDEPVKVIKKISESEDTSTGSSYNQSSSSSTKKDDNNVASSSSSSRSNKSIPASSSSSLKANSSVSNDIPVDIPIDLDMPMGKKNRQNNISFEYECENHSNSSITSTTYPVAIPSSITTDHGLSKTSSIQDTFQPEADIFGMKLRWPKFEIKNVPFEGRPYTLTLTCPIDTALFALYFMYQVDINMRDETDNTLPSSPYSTLLSTFRIVEKEGWDAARISWLLKFNLLKTSDRTKSLFGSVDELVFCFLKNSQRHSTTITCTNPDCTKRKRVISSTEIGLFPCDDHIENFEVETMGVCGAMIKRYDEMSETEATERKYRDGRVPFVDSETDEKEYIRAWICNHTTISSVSQFENEYPLVLIVNLKPFSKRSDEGYEPNPVRLRDMRKSIKINSIRYQLRATIHCNNFVSLDM